MSAKMIRYADNLSKGMTKKEAALKAGYSPAVANHTKQNIETKEGYLRYLNTIVPVQSALDVLSQQLDATKMAGVINNKPVIMPDNQARIKATEMALKLHGKFELDNSQQANKTLIMVNRHPDANPVIDI